MNATETQTLTPAAIADPLRTSPAATDNEARALAIVRDIYHMKLLAIEVVVQLDLDTIAANPGDDRLSERLNEQIAEELEHLDGARKVLVGMGALGSEPAFTKAFSRVMRHHARRRHRRLPLAVATILCTAVEIEVMGTLAALPDERLGAAGPILRQLGEDEEEHHELVTKRVAPDAARGAGRIERLHANMVVLESATIAVSMWWRRRVRDLNALGADGPGVIRRILDDCERSLVPLGVVFPRPLVDRLMDRALGLSKL